MRNFLTGALLVAVAGCAGYALARPAAITAQENETLTIVWTSADPDVAHRMTLMYGHAARTQGWFDEVTLVIWGPSQRLVVADKDIRAKVLDMQADGVLVQACVVCADSFGIAEDLEALGIEVKGMGLPLTEYIKRDGTHVVTF